MFIRYSLCTGITNEATDHLCFRATAAVLDGIEVAVDRLLNDVAAQSGRKRQIAAHQMRVVTRLYNDVAAMQDAGLAIGAIDLNAQLTLDDVVIGHEMRGCAERRPA